MSKTIILIPTFNEIKSLIKILPKILKQKYKIIIVNDASTDKTKKYLNLNKIECIHNKKRVGYEASLLKGMSYIIKNYRKNENIITFDSDGEHKVSDLNRILKFFIKDKVEFLICNRINIQRISEKMVNFFFHQKFHLKDPLTGLKVYKTVLLKKYIKKIKENFFLVDLAMLICSKNHRVENFPIECNIIKNRQPRIGNKFQANIKILRILKKVIRNK